MLMFVVITVADNCSLQRKEKIDEAHRNKKACEASIDYGKNSYSVCMLYFFSNVIDDFIPFGIVFKAVLLNEDEDMSTVYYKMKVEKSLKNGTVSL